MSAAIEVAAVDLGADSGRVVVAAFDGRSITQREVRRFGYPPRMVDGQLRWPMAQLQTQVQAGLAATIGHDLASVGVDAWGLDYALYDESGELIADPRWYRDPASAGTGAEIVDALGAAELFARTGSLANDWMAISQLVAEARTPAGRDRQSTARTLVMIADVVHACLSGELVCERTGASTSGMFDPHRGTWATDVLADLGLPSGIGGSLIDPGTVLGALRPGILPSRPGRPVQVIAPASHDTASAVVATPLQRGSLFVSSGTWSLTGVEVAQPQTGVAAMAADLVNERGVRGHRLLRNLTGLWLVQESRRQWEREGRSYSFTELTELARSATAYRSVIDVADPVFAQPGDLPARIRAYCRATAQPAPRNVGEIVRCALEGLALAYRRTAQDLARITGAAITTVHVVGGGSRNDLLNQLTADATGCVVAAGPVEAAALGNALVQLHALGEIADYDDLRRIVRRSDPPRMFTPRNTAQAQEAEARLTELRLLTTC